MMKLKRISFTTFGTFGVLFKVTEYGALPIATTLEPNWIDNEENKSCIPPGNYVCRRITSPKFGETFEITGVQDRTNILFHKGNTFKDTHGCVLVAEGFRESYVSNSLNGYTAFMDSLKGQSEALLVIENP
jgi:hypothetical protein